MKLHIGCGDRPIDGYLNIDLDAREYAQYAYLQADAASIPLGDGCAEEILSVHMIEHVWPWETLQMLKEWHRLLAPGGKCVIECPNIFKACQLLIGGMREKNMKAVAAAMNAFYGDPKDQELPGRHKWGYTPQSLSALLTAAGFENPTEEPAQFKMGESRDMRIVCEK